MNSNIKEIVETLNIMSIDSKLDFLVINVFSKLKSPGLIKAQKKLLKKLSE